MMSDAFIARVVLTTGEEFTQVDIAALEELIVPTFKRLHDIELIGICGWHLYVTGDND